MNTFALIEVYLLTTHVEKNQSTNLVAVRERKSKNLTGDIMIIPIRCFSCGGLIAHKWDEFNDKVSAGIEVSQAMDEVGLDRYCCRRMYLGHVELIHEAAPFSTYRKKS